MRRVTLALVLMVAVSAAAQDRKEYHLVNVPGTLESTLSLNPQSFVRHELGSLTPPGTVKLFAVVAFDQSSRRAVKGLEVQLEGDDIWNNNRHCQDTVYIDEDGLADFERKLSGLVDLENSDRARSEVPSVAFAGNTASGKPRDGVFYVPVEFGSYWSGTRYGIYVMAPHSRPTTGPHRTTQFRMPNADIGELLILVRDGRQWLKNSDSTMQPSDAAGR
jgi:hypothetical protein